MTSDAIDPRELGTEIEEPGHPVRSKRSHPLESTTYKTAALSLYEFCTDASKPCGRTH